MARSATKAAGESDVTAAGEKTLDFDDVTLRGEKKHVTVNSLYCRHPRDHELVALIARVVIAGIYFSQTSVIYFCRGFSCCPYYRGVRNSEVSARRVFYLFRIVG